MSKARTPSEHEAINAREWPGTRQICEICGDATERCEEDAIYIDDLGPLCPDCYHGVTGGKEAMRDE